jgi:hypothetical protein
VSRPHRSITPKGESQARHGPRLGPAVSHIPDRGTGLVHALPAPARPARPRFHHLGQPRTDGLDAHRTRGRAQALCRHGHLLCRACARRCRADRDGRLCPQHRGVGQALRRDAGHARRGPAAPRGDRRGACRGRQDRATDPAYRPLRLFTIVCRALPHPEPDLAIHAARAVRARHRTPDSRLRALRHVGPRSWLRRRRSDGQRGLLHQPVPGHAHQSPHRPLGRRV